MKRLFILLLTGSVLGISQAREFKSADGDKTIEAKFIRYNPRTGDVTLQMKDGSSMVAKANLFSEQDRAFFREQYRNEELQGTLSVRHHDKLTHETQYKGKLAIDITHADFTFKIENESDIKLENLKVKYWVVTQRNFDGKQSDEISEGETLIKELTADSEIEFKGPKIVLHRGAVATVNNRKNNHTQLFNEAAKYGKDRILGWRVEIYSSDDKVLFADSSSIRVDRALGTDKDEN